MLKPFHELTTEQRELRMARGWEGSSRALQRRLNSRDKRQTRFFTVVYFHNGRRFGNGQITGRNLVEAYARLKRMARDYEWKTMPRLEFSHYGASY